jgi:hypothetical protein
LTYGDLFILKNDEEAFVFVRSYFGQNVMVVMDKHLQQNENWTLEIPAEFKSVAYRSLIGNHYEISNGVLKQKTGSTNTEFLFEIFY